MSALQKSKITRNLQLACHDFPEIRTHLAHLRTMHDQRMRGEHACNLPKLKTRLVASRKEEENDLMIEVKLKLDPEVVDAFKATGRDREQSVNDIQAAFNDFPEIRVHLAHLRAMHYQRMRGEHAPILPKLKTRTVAPKKEAEDALMIEVRLKLDPEVVEAFKSTGSGWKQRVNDVLLDLVGKTPVSLECR